VTLTTEILQRSMPNTSDLKSGKREPWGSWGRHGGSEEVPHWRFDLKACVPAAVDLARHRRASLRIDPNVLRISWNRSGAAMLASAWQ
jgi:hypothetical protein